MRNKVLRSLSVLLLLAGLGLAGYLLPQIQREAAKNAAIESRGVAAPVVAVEVSEATAEGRYAAFWADVAEGRVSVRLARSLTQDQVLGKRFTILYDPVDLEGVESRAQLKGRSELLVGNGWPFIVCIALSLMTLASNHILQRRRSVPR